MEGWLNLVLFCLCLLVPKGSHLHSYLQSSAISHSP
jgi:hypothetical protein